RQLTALAPDLAQLLRQVDANAVTRRIGRRPRRPRHTFELTQYRRRDEAAARRIDMAVARRPLLLHEEAVRMNQMQIVLGPRHRDIEQPTFLIDLGGTADAEIRGNAAVDDVQDV